MLLRFGFGLGTQQVVVQFGGHRREDGGRCLLKIVVQFGGLKEAIDVC